MGSRLRRVGALARSNTQSSLASDASDASDTTHSAAPTSYTHQSDPSFDAFGRKVGSTESDLGPYGFDPRASSETYASTVPSDDDLPDGDEDPEFAVPDLPREAFGAEPFPSTPPEFAQLFPSPRRMLIRHDDTTEDGNMNLRVDAKDRDCSGRTCAFTLFHLRMYDLRDREFSLRRYCRDSGRELCHSSRKGVTPPVDQRPSLQRSMTNALASFRGKRSSRPTTPRSLRRQDSGYHSGDGLEDEERHDRGGDDDDDESGGLTRPSSARARDARRTLPTKTIRLDFSNYAHVNVKRRGTHRSKRYECEYWGRVYTWKRHFTVDGDRRKISYHLHDDRGGVLAHMVPLNMSPAEAELEKAKGGWVPPCTMWMAHPKALHDRTDLAE